MRTLSLRSQSQHTSTPQSPALFGQSFRRALSWGVAAGAITLGLEQAADHIGSLSDLSLLSVSGGTAALSAFAVTALGLYQAQKTLRHRLARTAGTELPAGAHSSTFAAPSAHVRDTQAIENGSFGPVGEALEDALYRRITTDPVTQVANRRHFLARLEETVAQTQREPDRQIALITFTISSPAFDLLYASNAVSPSKHDPLLALPHELRQSFQQLAQTCRASLRPGDLFCRLEKTCFAVLLPNALPRAAMACAERLRQAMEQVPLTDGDGLPLPYQATFGVATIKSGETALDLLARCQKAETTARRRDGAISFASSAPPMAVTKA